MKDLLILIAHLLTTIAQFLGTGGAKSVVADSLLMKQQLLIINRSRQRAPNLSTLDRFLLGFWSLLLNPRHLRRAAVIVRPSTLLKFHNLLKQQKYRLLTRRIVGFGIHAGDIDGITLCRIFNIALSSRGSPDYLSSDNDPLFQYHQWQANLRILGADEVKTVPYTPLSHPFVERLIGTIRRECLDHTLFWSAQDLVRKLEIFRQYYNAHRVHTSLDGDTPSDISGETTTQHADLSQFRWTSHCHGLFQLPAAA